MCVNESIVCVLLVYVECVVAAVCKQVESPVMFVREFGFEFRFVMVLL